MMKEDGLTLGDRHTVQYRGFISKKCILETYMILLTNVTLINLILEKTKLNKKQRVTNKVP